MNERTATPRPLRVVDPVATATVGRWHVHSWPDLPDSTGLTALRVPLPVGVGTRFAQNGWQSWSGARESVLGGRVTRRRDRACKVGRRHPLLVPPYDGDESYDVLAADGFVSGFVRGGGILVARPRRGDLLDVRDGPGPHPPLWCGEGDRLPLLVDLLDRVAGRVPRRPPTGWGSWYGCGPHVSAGSLRQQLRGAVAAGGIDAFVVDDGWQVAIGDWRANDRFPGGVAALASDIGAAGLEPGLWLSPLLVAEGSDLATRHPDWLAHDVPGVAIPHWRATTRPLDVTRSDVRVWLEDLFARLVDAGFGYFKLDFLFPAALVGTARPAWNGDTALREAVAAIRRGAGDAFVVASGSPLWPVAGLVDAMRIGPDVGPEWEAVPVPWLEPEFQPGLANAWRSSIVRAPLHGRLWANDPDCVLLRRRNTNLTPFQSRAWARWVAASGQLLTLSDSFADLDPDDIDLWRELAAGRHREVSSWSA